MAPTKKSQPKAKKVTYKIDCSVPVDDGIMEVEKFEEYLVSKIKVNGKTNNLGDAISVSKTNSTLMVTSTGAALSKRYLKYLSKRYLKKEEVRDWLRVVASDKNTYTIKYYKVNQGEEEEE